MTTFKALQVEKIMKVSRRIVKIVDDLLGASS